MVYCESYNLLVMFFPKRSKSMHLCMKNLLNKIDMAPSSEIIKKKNKNFYVDNL